MHPGSIPGEASKAIYIAQIFCFNCLEVRLMKFFDKVPLLPLVVMSLLLGLAPFTPEPHLFEKIRLLFAGALSKPIDIFDLLMHGSPVVLLVLKLARMAQIKVS